MKGLCVLGRDDRMGLGAMTSDFCAAMEPERLVIVDVGSHKGKMGDPLVASEIVHAPRDDVHLTAAIERLLRGMGWVVGFETFYADALVSVARQMGVKTCLFPMWEWSSLAQVAHSDVNVCLSGTDTQYYSGRGRFGRLLRCDWPSSPAVHDSGRVLNWPPRTFVHAAGNAAHNRDGTRQVLEAAGYLKGTPAKLIVYSSFTPSWPYDREAPIELRGPAPSRKALLDGCDCLVCPRRLGGHSLPINEAAGEGVPVVVLDLADWAGFPYRCQAANHHFERFGRVGAPVADADAADLGMLLRRLATGDVDRQKQWSPPGWDSFKNFWQEDVCSLTRP